MDARPPVRDGQGWFEVREMRPGAWMICEPGHVASWLILGNDRACLIDSGMGVMPIRPIVESITSLPITLVNTHYHFDHVGGNAEFDDVRAYPGATDGPHAPHDFVVDRYVEFASAREAKADQYRALDAELFGLLSPDTDPKPLLPDFRQRLLRANTGLVRTDLADEEQIDLGGRVLTALHTPGHSPDSMCFLDDKDGLLITGDTFNIGTIYCHFADSDVEALAMSAARLSGLESHVSYIAAHHYPRLIGETGLLTAFHTATSALLSQTSASTFDVLGQPCRYVTTDLFTFTLPAVGSIAVV